MFGRYGAPPPPPPAQNIYDLLRGIVDRTPWKSEAERNRYYELLAKIEQVNLFGYMSTKITTAEEEDGE